MGLSYAGDRLQELAQGWLIAVLTGSALAVGTLSILTSVPMLLMPLSGVISDQVSRRRLILNGQISGALLTGIIATLAIFQRLEIWHIYAWAFCSGVIWLLIRPAYKVIVTESVPEEEIREAVSINSITETAANAVMQGGGSALLASAGLPVAFVINVFTYLIGALCLYYLGKMDDQDSTSPQEIHYNLIISDLVKGLRYLWETKGLLYPLLFTLFGIIISSPVSILLPAIVQSEQGTIINLGVLGAALSIGALLGALFAGMVSEKDPLRTYALLGCCATLMILIFVHNPISFTGILAQAGLGFLSFSQVVWNTSRVPRLAAPSYQARLQAITSMVFTLGGPIGALWGGLAFDYFGINVFVISAIILGGFSAMILIRGWIKRKKDPTKPGI
jgi:MFS family permease